VDEHLLDDYLETCEMAARAGGHTILTLRGQFQTRAKAPADLVTDADFASQDAIQQVIKNRFPDHKFVGEEQAAVVPSPIDSEYAWIVDPLDGTTNYVHGYPHFAVSVALAKQSMLLVGTVYDPVANQCFVARRGTGAWRNGARIATSRVTNVADALVAVSLPARVRRDSPDLVDFNLAAQACQAVRRSGSAALNFAYVASGALDAFWATHIHPWDIAAGALLVREAGGVVTARNGGELDLWNPHFLAAANVELHRGLLDMLSPYDARRYTM
jgi:myo-inositol-1(or 4)-monophosphatase